MISRKLQFLSLLFLPISFVWGDTPEPVVIAAIHSSADTVAGEAVLREAYRRIGIPVDIRQMGGMEALEASSSGSVDAELQRIDGLVRRFPTLIQVPIPVNYLLGSAFSIEYDFRVTGWRNLQPYRIGIVKGIIFSKEGTQGMDVTVAEDYDQLFDMLKSGDIDVVVTPRINGLYALKKMNPGEDAEDNPVREMEGVLETLLLYHYVHQSRSEIVPELTQVLSEMLNDGTTRRIRNLAYEELLSE